MASTASDVEFLKNFASGKLLSAKNYIEMTLQKLIFDNFIFSEIWSLSEIFFSSFLTSEESISRNFLRWATFPKRNFSANESLRRYMAVIVIPDPILGRNFGRMIIGAKRPILCHWFRICRNFSKNAKSVSFLPFPVSF